MLSLAYMASYMREYGDTKIAKLSKYVATKKKVSGISAEKQKY